MFLFGKKKEAIKIDDVVFMNETAKWNACKLAFETNSETVFIAWFQETQHKLKAFLIEHNTLNTKVMLYREVSPHYIIDKQVIFVEHYPLNAKEATFFASLNLQEVRVFSCLEDALFQHFGGARIIELMQKMGLQENEPVQHPMIGMALKNAQEKLAKKVLFEQSAQSQQEWFNRNVG